MASWMRQRQHISEAADMGARGRTTADGSVVLNLHKGAGAYALLARTDGQLTRAGQHYYSHLGLRPPTKDFDYNQPLIREGPNDYILLRNGQKKLVRSLEASTGSPSWGRPSSETSTMSTWSTCRWSSAAGGAAGGTRARPTSGKTGYRSRARGRHDSAPRGTHRGAGGAAEPQLLRRAMRLRHQMHRLALLTEPRHDLARKVRLPSARQAGEQQGVAGRAALAGTQSSLPRCWRRACAVGITSRWASMRTDTRARPRSGGPGAHGRWPEGEEHMAKLSVNAMIGFLSHARLGALSHRSRKQQISHQQ